MAGLYDEKILGLRQQREFARKIREQADNGVEAGSMVSGHYVPNYGGMVANAMRQIMAGYEEGKAQNQEEDLTRQKLADSIKYMNQAGIEASPSLLAQAGTKAVEPSFFDSAGAFLTGKKPPETIPAQPYQQNVAQNVTPDQYEKAMAGVMGVNPEQANPMVAMYQAKQNRALKEAEDAYRKSHDEAVLAQQIDEKNKDRILREELAKQADTRARELAALVASTKQGREDNLVSVIDQKTGMPTLIPESQAKGMTPGSTWKAPADTKVIPANAMKAYQGNNSALNAIDTAHDLVAKNKDAFGLKNLLAPEMLIQRTDPEGVGARSAVADIGSQIIHDRTGAAMAIHEEPRLSPFVPSVNDTPDAIKTKLKQLSHKINEVQNGIFESYPSDTFKTEQFVPYEPSILSNKDSSTSKYGPAPKGAVTKVE